MSDDHGVGAYRCPECTGEFPQLDGGCCPWCGQEADGSYEFEPKVKSIVSSRDGGEDDRTKSLLGRIRS